MWCWVFIHSANAALQVKIFNRLSSHDRVEDNTYNYVFNIEMMHS